MKVNSAIISIGSNIDAEANIAGMIAYLGEKVKIVKVSPLIKTKPIGIVNQPDFTNGAARIETVLEREDFNQELKSIEDRLGRDRSLPKFGPRTIDLDIIAWNGTIVDNDYYTRDFLKKLVDELL